MKKLLTFLMMSVLAIGVGWAETIVFANLGLENGVQYLDPFDGGDFTVTFAGGANDGKYYDTGNGIRVYGGGTMTIAAKTGKITSITITFDGDNKPTTNNVVNVGAYDSSTGVWTGSASSVVFTRPSGSGHWRVKTISVIVGGTTIETVATPTFTPASGNYTEAQNVTINCATAGADIFWGYDGENFVSYDGSTILVNKTMTLYAYAMKSGMNNSAVAEANYTIKQLPNGAIFYESFDACDGLGGNDNKWNGNLTTTALASNILDNSGWGLLKAYPAKECARFGSSSDKGVATSPNINVVSGKVYALLFKAGAWNGSSENTDLIVTGLDEEGAPISVLYSDPSCSSVLSSVSMTKGAWTSYTVYIKPTTSKIKIEWSGEQAKNSRFFLDEVLLEEAVAPAVATPVIVGETPFLTSTEVTITCATEGATIYYTTNGDDPTTSSTLYSAPFTINATTTVKAIAVKNGQTSNIASKTFTAIPTIGSIEEFNALEPGDNFKYTASNLVAIKQYETTSTSGNKNYYLYAQYGEKGMLIFGNTGQTYQPGDVIPGGFTGTRAEFNGAPEMTNPAGFIASSQNVGLTPVEITPSQVNLDNFGRYAIIKNASFNTTNKIITAGDEEIPYHTTFMTPPTDGAVYDVIGICGYYKPQNGTAYPQFLPISFEPAEVTGAEYYLAGSFTNWAQDDTYKSYKFTKLANGDYKLNKTIADDVLFKVLKVEGEDVTWLGGGADGDYFGITKDVCTNISLVDGKNFYMAAGGNCTFTVSADQKLTVSKEAPVYLTLSEEDTLDIIEQIETFGKTHPFSDQLDGISKKLQLAFYNDEGVPAADRFEVLGRYYKRSSEIEEIYRKIEDIPYERYTVNITYKDKLGEVSSFPFNTGLVTYVADKDQMYMIGRRVGKDEDFVMTVERIQDIEVTDKPNNIYASVHYMDMFYDMFSISTEEPERVKIRFRDSFNIMDKLRSKFKYRTKYTLTKMDGYIYYEDEIRGASDLAKLLRSFGSSLEVIEPESLRKRMRDSAARSIERYRREGMV